MSDSFFGAASAGLMIGGATAAFAVASPAADGLGRALEGTLSAGGVALILVALLAVASVVREVTGL